MSASTMPPEPPPVTGENDYVNSGAQRQIGASKRDHPPASVIGTTAVSVYGIDVPIPAHLTEREPTPDLNAAVAAVLAEPSDSIPKRGYNKFHDYAYATADDIRSYVANKLGRHGLSYEQHEVGYTPFGNLIAIHYYFVMAHASGQRGVPQRVTVLAQMISNNGKPDDKAFSKAGVLALKDWSKLKFSIATGDPLDDPDADETAPTAPPPPRQPTRSSSGASVAFRNQGTTKVQPPAPTAPPTPPLDPWVYGQIKLLENEKRGHKWMDILRAAMPHCKTFEQISQLEESDTVVSAKNNPEVPAHIKDKITELFTEATNRVGAAESNPQKDKEPDWTDDKPAT